MSPKLPPAFVTSYFCAFGRMPDGMVERRPVTVFRRWWQFWKPPAWEEMRPVYVIRGEFTTMTLDL